MPYFVQYSPETGEILAIISGQTAPVHDHQIVSESYVDIVSSKVNLETLSLEPYTPPPPSIEEQILARVKEAAVFGQELVMLYGVKNVMRGYTTSQVGQVATVLSAIVTLLQSGALYTAKEAIEALEPSEIITQEDRDEFLGKINGFLGIPEAVVASISPKSKRSKSRKTMEA